MGQNLHILDFKSQQEMMIADKFVKDLSQLQNNDADPATYIAFGDMLLHSNIHLLEQAFTKNSTRYVKHCEGKDIGLIALLMRVSEYLADYVILTHESNHYRYKFAVELHAQCELLMNHVDTDYMHVHAIVLINEAMDAKSDDLSLILLTHALANIERQQQEQQRCKAA